MQFSKVSKLDFALVNVFSKKRKQSHFRINYHLLFNIPWSSPKRREHLPDSPRCQLKIMGLPCTSPHSRMLPLSDMAGHFRIHHHTAPVAIHSALNMHPPAKTGGFPALRHNEVRDITASLLSEVCHGVTIEPHLQSLSGEVMSYNFAITEDKARLDVAMCGFWGGRHL